MMEESIVMQSVNNTSQNPKSFEELSQLYENIKLEMCTKNADSKTIQYAPVLQYVSEMLSVSENKSAEEILRLLIIKTCISYDEAKHLIVHGNVSSSLEALNASLNLVEDKKLHPHVTFLYFRILNQFACYQAKNNLLDKAKTLLENAEGLYTEIEKPSDILVYTTEDVLDNSYIKKSDKSIKFEKLITNNLQIQGWIYNKLKQNSKFIIYQHRILRRQLETEDGNIISWVFKCARLGSYFFGSYKFREARYHLAAAQYVLGEYELDLLTYRSEPHFVTEWSNLQKYYADLGKYWIKYGMFLFEASRNNFLNTTKTDSNISELLNCFNTSRKTFNTVDRPNFKLSEEKYGKENSINLNDIQNAFSIELLLKTGLLKTEKDGEINNDTEKIKMKDDEQEETKNSELIDETKSTNEISTEEKAVDLNPPTEKIVETQKPTTETEKLVTEKELDGDTNKTEIKVEDKTDLKEDTQASELQDSIKTEETSSAEESSKTEEPSNAQEILDYKFIFPSLNLTYIESKVDANLVQSTDTARFLYQFIQDWIQRCSDFYNIQNAPIQYINLILDLSEINRYLLKFERNLEDQYEVQNRRVLVLESLSVIVKEFQPHYYLSLNIELLSELTEAQIELLGINIKKLHQAKSLPLAQMFDKREQSIRKMEALIDIRKRLSPPDSTQVGPRISIFDLKQLGLA